MVLDHQGRRGVGREAGRGGLRRSREDTVRPCQTAFGMSKEHFAPNVAQFNRREGAARFGF